MNDDLAISIAHRFLMGPSTSLQYFPPEEHDGMLEYLIHIIGDILETDGPGAFESSRSASIAHEVGHAIVLAHDDVPVEKIAVWKKQLSHACFVIAGEVGELLLDPDGYREGTSLDEVLFSQRIARAVAKRVKMEAEDLWQEIRKRSWQIIAHNAPVARELISRLDRTESLQRRALTAPMEKVQKIPDDWCWLPQGAAN